jgi:hypothetical protein
MVDSRSKPQYNIHINTKENLMAILLAALGIAGLLFVAVILSTLIGGIVGWIIGLVFPYVIATLNTLTGLTLTGFEMGAALGFVGSFFKSTTTVKKD